MTAPPNALTKEKFDKAIKEGKRTMEEIDPAFMKWYKETGHLSWHIPVIIVILAMMIVMILKVFLK